MSVEVLNSKEVGDYRDFFEELALAYMIIFGNSVLKEGGVRSDGSRLGLAEYLKLFPVSLGSDATPLSSWEQRAILKYLAKLPSEERADMYSSVEANSGYKPFYRLEEVENRFLRELTTTETAKPVVAFWGDEKFPICGFATGVVVKEITALEKLLAGMTYLDTSGEFSTTVEQFLRKSDTQLPLLLDHEAGVLPEYAGTSNGSQWRQVLLMQRQAGRSLGAQRSLTVTYPQSRYYRSGRMRSEFVAEQAIGEDFVMVVVDLEKAIADLM